MENDTTFKNMSVMWTVMSNCSYKMVTKTYVYYISLFLLITGYTLFALFEYLVVFSNMAFHLTAVWDFKSREVMVISSSEDKDF